MAALETTVFSFTLLADTPKMQLLVTGLCLATALLLGAGVLALLRRWWQRRGLEDDQSPSAQLAHFRSLYESGTISQEEFERLRALLGARLRETMGMSLSDKVAGSLRESDPTRGASRPPSDKPMEPPSGQNGQPPDHPETGIRPA
ncbi:MAG TPA: SHOCT domain-containing protein [Gemmataceae bacterium]|nr:SHOCT domain-containing protein [Gemmataceae bacterium]